MPLSSLRVTHLSKKVKAKELRELIPANAFELDTCQRQLWVYYSDKNTKSKYTFEGIEAYDFLLRVATGLESEVRGEADVFGQLKESWAKFEQSGSPLLAELSPWMKRVFEDTKEIRAQFLQNVGAGSYGSLTRKILRQHAFSPEQEPVLVIGAGHIARSIAPWLAEHELWVWNRTARSIKAFTDELIEKCDAKFKTITGQEQEEWAWKNAVHVVVCIPLDSEADERRIKLWLEGVPGPNRSIIHLGGLREQCSAWNNLPGFHSLDDLFELQKKQDEVRTAQLSRALKACEEKARLRSMAASAGSSISLPHGWEDLATFS